MKKMHIFFAALFISISFCPPAFAKLEKIPLDTSQFWFWYGSHSGSGPGKELNPNDSFKIMDQKVHISCGNLFDKERRYQTDMTPQGEVISYGDFKFELTFKNFISSNADYQNMSFKIMTNSRNVSIEISKEGPYYQYSTWVLPDDIGGLTLSTLSNSGTFIIEQEGNNITLSVKGVPHATWT